MTAILIGILVIIVLGLAVFIMARALIAQGRKIKEAEEAARHAVEETRLISAELRRRDELAKKTGEIRDEQIENHNRATDFGGSVDVLSHLSATRSGVRRPSASAD